MRKNIFSLILLGLVTATQPVFAGPQAVTVYLTAKDTTNRLANTGPVPFADKAQPTERERSIFVDPSKTFQTVLGIGGALTDASAETFYKLPKAKQQELMTAYFDAKDGIGYTLARTHIHSCDFSSESYTYTEPGDRDLKTFNIAHDLKYRVPFIKEAIATANGKFTIYASPWSPPAWMKDSNDILHGGKLRADWADTWAKYYVKFIQAYEQAGIPIWGLTVQNEPLATQTWESCIFTGEEERDFVKNHLGPTLWKAGLKSKKLIVWDHNRDLLYQRAAAVLDDPAAAKYVWGVGLHWYVGDHFENVQRVQEAFPKANLLFTEGCNYPYSTARLDDWHWGENYGKSMIHDFNNGVVGWTDWNVLLDETGGPNHVSNFCFAPVHGDTKTGELHYMNSFYYIGHFSKFVRPGAKRIISSSTYDDLLTTAFLNPDGKVAVIVMNVSDTEQPFYLWLKGRAARTTSPAHSMMTLVF